MRDSEMAFRSFARIDRRSNEASEVRIRMDGYRYTSAESVLLR